MSRTPPKLDTTDPGTPAKEWAQSTTTAAFARSDPAPATAQSSADTTTTTSSSQHDPSTNPATTSTGVESMPAGGEDVPGAYPVGPGDTGSAQHKSVKDTAVHAAEVSYAYAASAASTAASYIPRGVVDTVSSYIPTSHATATMHTARASEHDAMHKTSLPTTEYSGAASHEHIGGVGALPGPMNEAGVAKLPDENTEEERYLTAVAAGAAVAAGIYGAKESVVGGAKGAAQTARGRAQSATEPTKKPLPASQRTTSVTASTLPSHEPTGAHPGDHSMGVGALPGNQSEPHVARLPEESIHPQYDSGEVDTAAQVSMKPSEELHGNEAATGEARHCGGVGALVGDRSEESVAKLPDERQAEEKAAFTPATSGEETYIHVGPRGDPGAGMRHPTSEEGQMVAKGGPYDATGERYIHVGPRGDPGAGLHHPTSQEGQLILEQGHRETGAHQEHHHHHHKHHHEAVGTAVAGAAATGTAVTEHREQQETAPPPGEEQSRGEVKERGRDQQKVTGATGGTSGRPNRGPGYQTDYHPAQLHPREETTTQASPQAAEGQKSLGTTQADTSQQQKPPQGQETQTQTQKKASFMEKMRGEARVLLGKIEGKHEKVAEGERMKPSDPQAAAAQMQKEA